MARQRPSKRYLKIDEIAEVSGVDVPAQEGARVVAIGKAASLVSVAKAKGTDNDADDVEKDIVTCPKCGAKIDPDGDESPTDAQKRHFAKCYGMAKRDFSDKERSRLADTGAAMDDGSYPITNGSDLSNAVEAWGRAPDDKRAAVARHIKGRAKSLGLTDKLPDSGPLAEALGTAKRAPTEETMTTDLDTLTKRATDAEALAKFWRGVAMLPEAQRGYCLALPEAQRADYLAKSATDRAKDAEPVHVSKVTGQRYYAHDDQRTVEMAKAFDAQAEELNKARQANDDLRFAKQADEILSHSPGSEAVRCALVKAACGIADEELRKGALAALKAGDSAIEKAYGRAGRSFGLSEQEQQEAVSKAAEATPDGFWDAQVAKHQAANKIAKRGDAEAAFLDTDEGRAAYKRYEDMRRDAARN